MLKRWLENKKRKYNRDDGTFFLNNADVLIEILSYLDDPRSVLSSVCKSFYNAMTHHPILNFSHAAHASMMSNVRSLSIKQTHSMSFGTVAKFIENLPSASKNLKSFSGTFSCTYLARHAMETMLPNTKELKSFSLCTNDADMGTYELLAHLLHSNPQLKTLSVSLKHVACREAFEALARSNVKRLELQIPDYCSKAPTSMHYRTNQFDVSLLNNLYGTQHALEKIIIRMSSKNYPSSVTGKTIGKMAANVERSDVTLADGLVTKFFSGYSNVRFESCRNSDLIVRTQDRFHFPYVVSCLIWEGHQDKLRSLEIHSRYRIDARGDGLLRLFRKRRNLKRLIIPDILVDLREFVHYPLEELHALIEDIEDVAKVTMIGTKKLSLRYCVGSHERAQELENVLKEAIPNRFVSFKKL